MTKPRIGSEAYDASFPERFCVFNSKYDEDGSLTGTRLKNTWVVSLNGYWVRHYPSQETAFSFAFGQAQEAKREGLLDQIEKKVAEKNAEISRLTDEVTFMLECWAKLMRD